MNTKKITKKAFLAAAKKGWEKLEYNNRAWWLDAKGDGTSKERAVSACALGAAAYVLGMGGPEICRTLDPDEFNYPLSRQIAEASNGAGSKEAALRAISKLKWSAKP